MRVIPKAKGFLAIAYFALVCVSSAVPHFLCLYVAHRLARLVRRTDGSAYRRRCAAWQVLWARVVFAGVRRIIGFEADLRLPPEAPGERGPLIIVSNHVSMLDMLLIAVLIGRTGRRDLRWVMAEERRRDPFIPWACHEAGSVFVRRDGDPSAREEVARCARLASADGASVVIFPEGTRFRGPKAGSGYSRVLPPRTGGFSVFRRILPGRPVLSITIRWEGPRGGVGLGALGDYAGRKLVMETRLVPAIVGMSDEAFLEDDFRRKDRTLTRTG